MISKTRASTMAFFLCFSSIALATATSEYLGNNQRTGYVDAQIPSAPVLLWTYHEKHPPRHAWREPNREVQYIDFDYATQAAIGHDMVFFGSSADHKVYALDLASAEERWTFYTEGPVRFAPVVHRDRVYVASDDGYLYCLKAGMGELVWKFRGGPGDDKLIGNDQMISHWPARSGVLIEQDRLFFTAGMWSRDGAFIYCLDPDDGSVRWRNDTSGYHFMTLPHASGFGGVAPQGYLLHHRNLLYVPTGRGAPACFDAETGEFVFYENGLGYKPHQPGGSWVMAWEDSVIFKRRQQHVEESVRYEERDPGSSIASGLFALDYRTGEPQWSLTDKNLAVASGNAMILAGAGPVIKVDVGELMAAYPRYYRNGKTIAYDENIAEPDVRYINMGILRNAKKLSGNPIPKPAWMSPVPFSKWATDVGRVYFMLQVGRTVLTGGRRQVTALDSDTGRILWQRTIDGNARGICAANGHFIVSSTAGKLYCFGEGSSDTGTEITHATKKPAADPEIRTLADSIVRNSGIEAGYCLMLGTGDGRLICELADRTELVIYCLEPDRAKAASIRRILDAAGLLGVRAAVHHGPLNKLPYNPYFANLIIWGDKLGSNTRTLEARELYRVLRPYGGVACQLAGGDSASATRRWLADGGVPEREVSSSSLGLIVKRGNIPGAGEWTHPHADIGRTSSSGDRIARLPLGMLWWGGPGPARMVSRHWRAPVPLFSGGVLFIQGQHDIIAVDAYNGREMWNRHLENVGRFPPTHRGGNIVADENSVYCLQGPKCLRLDAQTGRTLKEYVFPLGQAHRRAMAELLGNYPPDVGASRIVWEYLGVSGEHLVGTLGNEIEAQPGQTPYSKAIQQSRYIFAFDKVTGELLWEHLAQRAVSPVAIVADRRNLYFLDRSDEILYQQSKRRARTDGLASSLKALDLETGELRWVKNAVPLERKALMLKDDVIVALPNPAEKTTDEGDNGVAVYSTVNGELLWEKKTLKEVSDPARGWVIRHSFIVGDTLFLPWAFDLRTGKERLLRSNPLTGAQERFTLFGKNFCGTVAAGEDIVAYRSASVGFAEIATDSGSHWFPETRPSCWISVIPAGGIVLAPEGYSSCICPYNYKTSLALVPTERNENWSIYLAGGRHELRKVRQAAAARKKQRKTPTDEPTAVQRIRSLRVNLNAPGDRMDSDGRLWMAHPRPLTQSNHYLALALPVELQGQERRFRYNSDHYAIDGTQAPWLYTSGLQGQLLFTIQLSDNEEHAYTVRLHFAETEDLEPGSRVFHVKLQDRTVFSRVDIVKEAGAANRALIKVVRGVAARGTMTIELAPVTGGAPLVCALEVVEE